MNDHLVLIDGHHLMYRAFYAVPQSLKVKASGELTNVTYGVASMLLNIIKTEQPTHLLFAFDAGEETFRHAENAAYKEGRTETPDEFYVQIPRVMEFLQTFQAAVASNPKYEADDFLCAYGRAGEKAGMKVTIVTGDRDALQIATKKIRIAIPHKGYQEPEYLDDAGVLAKYGVTPEQIPAYKGLTGDSSDNLPGVKGIGPKTASQLIQDYGSLANIYEHLGDIKESVRKKLEADKESAFFCEHMATLLCDIPMPVSLEDTALHNIRLDPVLELFKTLDFNTLSKRYREVAASDYGAKHFVAPAEQLLKAPVRKAVGEDQMTLF